jgi:hypothetical protein
VSWAAAAGIGISGCSAPEIPSHAIEVTNISSYDIEMSKNPQMYTPDLRAGTIKVGQKAMATCLRAHSDSPERMGMRVVHEREVGYISLFSASSKDVEGTQQIEPGFDKLKELPPCYPPVKAQVKEKVTGRTSEGDIKLEVGTLLTAQCKNAPPFSLQAEITSGPYAGQIADTIPRGKLEALDDPYGMIRQEPAKDPFLPLPLCTEY